MRAPPKTRKAPQTARKTTAGKRIRRLLRARNRQAWRADGGGPVRPSSEERRARPSRRGEARGRSEAFPRGRARASARRGGRGKGRAWAPPSTPLSSLPGGRLLPGASCDASFAELLCDFCDLALRSIARVERHD